jgi:hypothetical protein
MALKKLTQDEKVVDAEVVETVEEVGTVEETMNETKQTEVEVMTEKVSTELAKVADQPVATTVTEQRQQGAKQFIEEMAAMGMEGIEIGGFSFDRIKLHEGRFKLGTDEIDLGDKFQFQVATSRNIFIIKRDNSADSEVYYSYDADGSTTTDGQPTSQRQEWIEDGYETEVAKYLEVTGFLKGRDDEYDETPVTLSIPPSSIQRFGGKALEAKIKFGVTVDQVILEASVGSKVGEGQKAFRPWNFKVVSRA